jgi:anti-repressor protein
MTELIIIRKGEIGGSPISTVSLRDLHEFLEVKSEFRNWVKNRIDDFGFVENQDFATTVEIYRGGERKQYHGTIDMAKELAMVERNEKGKQARQYFIECERRLKEAAPLQIDVRDPSQLTKIAIQLIEVNKELEHRAVTAEKAVEAAKPKTEFYDTFSSADGLYGLQNAARVLGQAPNKFIGWLKQGYIFYQGGALVPKVQYREMGVFEVKSTLVDDKARYQTYVTPKGIQYFAKKLGAPQEITE